MLPLFHQKATSPAMVKHAKNIDHLNPGQIPVVVCDQQLFVLAKLIQWKWPEENVGQLGRGQVRGGDAWRTTH